MLHIRAVVANYLASARLQFALPVDFLASRSQTYRMATAACVLGQWAVFRITRTFVVTCVICHL